MQNTISHRQVYISPDKSKEEAVIYTNYCNWTESNFCVWMHLFLGKPRQNADGSLQAAYRPNSV